MSKIYMPLNHKQLEKILKIIGCSILKTAYNSRSGHIGGSLSLIQLLTYYINYIENINVKWKIILSKGHSSLGLYSLFESLKIENDLINNYCLIPGGFHGHTCAKASEKIIVSTGSLGHGLPIAAGYSYANFKKGKNCQTLCVIGDGDLQEGSNLEIIHSLDRLKDCNLKIIIDSNDSVESKFISVNQFFVTLQNLYPKEKFIESFNMNYFNQHEKLAEWLNRSGLKIANCKTKKAFGFKKMYNDPKWHAGIPSSSDELNEIIETSDFSLMA